MKIKMLDTVEDTYAFVAKDTKTKKQQVCYDTKVCKKGIEYDGEGHTEDLWNDRATMLVEGGYAEVVDEQWMVSTLYRSIVGAR